MFNPVDGFSNFSAIEIPEMLLVIWPHIFFNAENFLVLFMAPVRELVVTSIPAVILLIDQIDCKIGCNEVLKALAELIHGVDSLAKLRQVIGVFKFVLV